MCLHILGYCTSLERWECVMETHKMVAAADVWNLSTSIYQQYC